MQVTKIGSLRLGDIFNHRHSTYEVLELDYVFLKAKKISEPDSANYYFLTDIIVTERRNSIDDTYFTTNPDYDISDLRKQNND